MAMLAELKQNRHEAFTKAETILQAAEAAGRGLTDAESESVDTATAEARDLGSRITAIEKQNTLRAMNPTGVIPGVTSSAVTNTANVQRRLSADYGKAFHA